jgi:ankyrin repeat protein
MDKYEATDKAINCAWNKANLATEHFAEIAGYDVEDEAGNNLLEIAIKTKNPELVELLVEKGIDINEIRDDMTPLQHSLQDVSNEKSKEIITVLIEGGADVNLETESFDSPLKMAIMNKDIQVISSLIDAGADVNAKDKKGDTMLHVASLTTTNTDIVELLITAGADVEGKNKEDLTAYEAVKKIDNPDIINYYETNEKKQDNQERKENISKDEIV